MIKRLLDLLGHAGFGVIRPRSVDGVAEHEHECESHGDCGCQEQGGELWGLGTFHGMCPEMWLNKGEETCITGYKPLNICYRVIELGTSVEADGFGQEPG